MTKQSKAFDELMGQFAENDSELEEGYMKGYPNISWIAVASMHNCKPEPWMSPRPT